MNSGPETERNFETFIPEANNALPGNLRPPLRHFINCYHLIEQKSAPKVIHFKTQKFAIIELSPPIRSKKLKRSLQRAKIIHHLVIDFSLGFKFTQRLLKLLLIFKIRHLDVIIKHPSYMYHDNFGPFLKLLRNRKIESFGLTLSIPLDIITTLMAMHYRSFAIFKDDHMYSILRRIQGLKRLKMLKIHLLSESFIHLTNQSLINLSNTLIRKTKLKVLDLNCSLKEASEESLMTFGKSLESLTKMRNIALSIKGLRKFDIDPLLGSLSRLDKINCLNLSTDNVMDEGNTKVLSECCRRIPELERLQLSYLPAHSNAYNTFFSEGLQSLKTLTDLGLQMYSMNEVETYDLVDSLKALATLRKLTLNFYLTTFNKRVTKNIVESFSAMNEMDSVTLKFSQCKMCDPRKLLSCFKNMFELRSLSLHFLHMNDLFNEECLLKLLRCIEKLTYLDNFELVLTGNVSVNLKTVLPLLTAFINTHENLINFKMDLPKSAFLEVKPKDILALMRSKRCKKMANFLMMHEGTSFQIF